jgi:hypothetical protein
MDPLRDNQSSTALSAAKRHTSSPAVRDQAGADDGSYRRRSAPGLRRRLERIWVPRHVSRAAHIQWAPPNHAAGVNTGSVRSRCQRARSNGSPVCMMCSSIGTMRRAIAHSALVLRPPFRALSASYAGRYGPLR